MTITSIIISNWIYNMQNTTTKRTKWRGGSREQYKIKTVIVHNCKVSTNLKGTAILYGLPQWLSE